MMSRKFLLFALIFTALFVFTIHTTWALPYTVTLDVSSIAGSEFELLFELFDNDFIIGNTSVLIDNVFISDCRNCRNKLADCSTKQGDETN